MINRRYEGGVALLIVVLIVLAIAAVGALVAGSISSSDVTDSHLNGYAIEAQFAAETGIERAMREFAATAYAAPPAAAVNPCAAGVFNAGPFTVVAGRTFSTTFKGTTDFDGVTLLPFAQCRVEVLGTVAGTSTVTRKVQAILDRNLAAGANPGFNNIVGGGATAVSLWTSTATPIPFDVAGGPEAAPTAVPATRCTRAAYAVKSRSQGAGGIAAQSTGSVPIVPNFVVTAGQTVTVRFNYRVIRIANSTNNACTTTAAGVVVPGGTAVNNAQIWFSLTDSANAVFTTVAARVFTVAQTNPGAPLNTRTVGNGLPCTPTTQQVNAATDYPTCASFYGAGTPANKAQSSVVVGGTGIIKQLNYFIVLPNTAGTTAREAWIDNIELLNGTGTGVARTAEWRDCAVLGCL